MMVAEKKKSMLLTASERKLICAKRKGAEGEVYLELTPLGRDPKIALMLAPFRNYDETKMLAAASKADLWLKQSHLKLTRRNVMNYLEQVTWCDGIHAQAACDFLFDLSSLVDLDVV